MKRLLIVDDENELRNAMIDLIPWEQYGYNVIGAVENGEQAVDLLEQHPIDLLITDLIMPKMDGLQLIQQAKRIQPTLHILILSNYSEFDYVKQALQLGASDYLLKASFSEKEIAPLLTRFNQDTPNLLVSHSAEMQVKLLLTTSAVNSDQHAFFEVPNQTSFITCSKSNQTTGKIQATVERILRTTFSKYIDRFSTLSKNVSFFH